MLILVRIMHKPSCVNSLQDIVPVYDCAINTKEGTIIHAHKRYSEFAELHSMLRHTLPVGFRLLFEL